MSTQVKRILGGRGWEPLVDANGDDGEKMKIYQLQKGKNSTLVIYTEEDDESALIVIEGIAWSDHRTVQRDRQTA